MKTRSENMSMKLSPLFYVGVHQVVRKGAFKKAKLHEVKQFLDEVCVSAGYVARLQRCA